MKQFGGDSEHGTARKTPLTVRVRVPGRVVVGGPAGSGRVGVLEEHVEGVRAEELPEHLLGVPEGEAEEGRGEAVLEAHAPHAAVGVVVVVSGARAHAAAPGPVEALLAVPVVNLALLVCDAKDYKKMCRQ